MQTKNLKINFPNKKFHIYLDCDFFDHVIIRFHQHWEDELPYYNVREFPNIEEYTIRHVNIFAEQRMVK